MLLDKRTVAAACNTIAQVFDHVKLALIHPSGDSDEHKPEWIEHCRHLVASLSTSYKDLASKRIINKIRFSGHTRAAARLRTQIVDSSAA